ncbi:MAG: acyltransferase family protein [Acidobacteriaceae bacterium]
MSIKVPTRERRRMSDDGSAMESVAKPTQQRVLSVDVLRGMTIALMILVNDPGDWGHVYAQLDHAAWNGFTLTDQVFPNFLFLVGASIIFSLEGRVARGESRRVLALHMLRRAATLFAIKMFLTAFPHFQWTHLRLFGVLTRIAVCYLAVGLVCLVTRRVRVLLAIAAGLLVGYWAMMRFVPVPGFGVPTHAMPILDPEQNLAAWLDRAFTEFTQRTIHTGSLYNRTHDPEGLLSTLPAIATTLMGAVAGVWMRRAAGANEGRAFGSITRERCLTGLLLAGIAGIAAGLAWNHWFPINKNLWTSSYALFSGGISLVLLALCTWLIDLRRMNKRPVGRGLLWPWIVFGSNAITAFVLSNFIVEVMLWIKVPAAAMVNPAAPVSSVSAWLWLYQHGFAHGHSTELSSLAFALAFTAMCFVPNWILWRKKIFLKIG